MKDLRIKISKSGATIAIVYIDQSKCINGRNTGELVKRLQDLAKIGKQKLRSIMNIQKDGSSTCEADSPRPCRDMVKR